MTLVTIGYAADLAMGLSLIVVLVILIGFVIGWWRVRCWLRRLRPRPPRPIASPEDARRRAQLRALAATDYGTFAARRRKNGRPS